jgi:hypothetical protein
MPVRRLPGVSQEYFAPKVPALEPRTAWSLHNACTSAAKEMPMPTRLPAIQAVGKLFGTSNDAALALPSYGRQRKLKCGPEIRSAQPVQRDWLPFINE